MKHWSVGIATIDAIKTKNTHKIVTFSFTVNALKYQVEQSFESFSFEVVHALDRPASDYDTHKGGSHWGQSERTSLSDRVVLDKNLKIGDKIAILHHPQNPEKAIVFPGPLEQWATDFSEFAPL